MLILLTALAMVCFAPAVRAATPPAPGVRLGMARQTGNQAAVPSTLPRSAGLEQENRMTGIVDGEGSEFGEQVILKKRAHVEPWKVAADVMFAYTDNAALTNEAKVADCYMRAGLKISYTNRIKGPFFLDASLQYSTFRYQEYDILDFDYARFEAGGLLHAPWLGDSFFVMRYSYTRYTQSNFGDEFFSNNSAILGLQKVWQFSRGQSLFAGLSADISIAANPALMARDEVSLAIGYGLRMTKKLTAQASYRISFDRYRSGVLEEVNQIGALGLSYSITDQITIGASASFSTNNASKEWANYTNLVAGPTLSIQAVF